MLQFSISRSDTTIDWKKVGSAENAEDAQERGNPKETPGG
jgi:hypothetical protein